MSITYLSAVVPADLQPTAEGLVAPFMVSPNAPGVDTFSVPLVPFDGPSDATPTHFGCNGPITEGGVLASALAQLVAALPGSSYQTVAPADWDVSRDWVGWLAGLGLQPWVIPEE
jgi:hypothetical protein